VITIQLMLRAVCVSMCDVVDVVYCGKTLKQIKLVSGASVTRQDSYFVL